jgi:hypothetical protein
MGVARGINTGLLMKRMAKKNFTILSSSHWRVLCSRFSTATSQLVTPSKLQIPDSPASTPSCLRFDLSNNVDYDRMFRDVAEKAPGNPKRLDSIVQAPLMRVC